ncbi:uncharacterized protein LOC142358258, partial [Convolutriloba macropyga]|uniref:uncharacterized protein LOC142358258 n=1 Tax=Convolutriloba macropyga TaxID=536237 RepID=UPI003F51D869
RRLPVISSSKFGRRLFDSDEYIFFKVKATHVMLTFISHLISACPPSSLKLDHLGVITLELISQNVLQPRKFSQKKETICEDLVFPQTQQHFGDLRVKGIAIFRQIWELCLKTIPKNTPSLVGKPTDLPLQTGETDFTLVDFINFCCCDLVRLSVAMDYAITRPLCYVITEMIAEMPQLCEQHVISTLIQFDLQRNMIDSEVRVRKYFYDRINSGGFPREKKKKVDEMKSRLQTLLDAQQLNIKSGDADDRASFLAITLRLSYLIKFYSAQDQSQYRMFKDLYLRQMIKTLSEPDLGGGSSFDQQDPAGFYRAEIAQCYVSLAELCDSNRKMSRVQKEEQPKDDSIEKLELLEQAAINFHQAGRLVQAEKIFHEIEEGYRSKWLLKRLQAIRAKLDQLYESISSETLENLTAMSCGQPEWFYYVRLYGNLPSAVEDSGFIIRVPTSVEVSEAAREITRIFPDIQRQNIGTDPHTAKLDPGEAYFQISLTEVRNSDSAKERLQIRRSQLKSVGTSLGSPTSAYKPERHFDMESSFDPVNYAMGIVNAPVKLTAKLVSSKFYSTLKAEPEVDESLTSFENVISSLNAKSETSTFSTKWVQPNDQKL